MKLSAFKNNQLISEVDLSRELAGTEDGTRNFFIGRSKSCHLMIEDIGISREHIQIIYEKSVWKMKRKANFGMVALNGGLVDESEIKSGDIIAVGAFQIIISQTGMEDQVQNIQDASPRETAEIQEGQEVEESAQAQQEQDRQNDVQVEFDEIPEEKAPGQENIGEATVDDKIEDGQGSDQKNLTKTLLNSQWKWIKERTRCRIH